MTPVDDQFEALLVYLREARGFDFTGYKRSSLMRRVTRRMTDVQITGYAEYLDYLQVHPTEFTALFNTILINVTAFFRDPDAWEYLREQVVKPLLASKPDESPVRVWSAGCASGEEAYTLAIVLAEILGVEGFRQRVKIYATDVDEDRLNEARQAAYGPKEVAGVPAELLERYFDDSGGRFVFRKDLRRSVIFGRNDLVQDAPISRIDLLVCRNTLMYFNAETQARILGRFHFALIEDGALFLGKAEMLLSHASTFVPTDLKRRVFRKVPRALLPDGPLIGQSGSYRAGFTGPDRLRNEAFLASPVAQLVVTSDGLLALANRQADALFGVSVRDIGRPFHDLEISYQPVELRKHIEQARTERRTLDIKDIEYARGPNDTVHLEVQVNPIVDSHSSLLGVTLVFQDVTAARQLRDELKYAHQRLEGAFEELQSTNEELETTNEELQSTVEELETTNEELQSTNEELETMNEELQSTNDELQSINEQLQASTAQLDNANAFLDAILASLRAGIAVVDRDLRLQAWNRQAEELWGLRTAEVVGQHLLNLDIGLPVDRLRLVLKQALAGDSKAEEVRLPAVNRRGRTISVRVACSPLTDLANDTSGAIIVMETDDETAGDGADRPGVGLSSAP
jgi:two-component system CheB/CheR fusion protein